MPTHDEDERFWDDFARLTSAQRKAFILAVGRFVADLEVGTFRKGLRVKRVEGRPRVWEMTGADDGRATFSYGESIVPGEFHIIWRRIGSHDIFDNPLSPPRQRPNTVRSMCHPENPVPTHGEAGIGDGAGTAAVPAVLIILADARGQALAFYRRHPGA